MNNQEFSSFRQKLQKTQKEMAELLGTSLKTVQSFEQGWRKVPVHIERQMLFLLNMKKGKARDARPCWDIQNCSVQARQGCPAWEFNAGDLCWFINGTICLGKPQNSWSHKMRVCRKCAVFTKNFGTTALGRTSKGRGAGSPYLGPGFTLTFIGKEVDGNIPKKTLKKGLDKIYR